MLIGENTSHILLCEVFLLILKAVFLVCIQVHLGLENITYHSLVCSYFCFVIHKIIV